jgi:hypothetical protein
MTKAGSFASRAANKMAAATRRRVSLATPDYHVSDSEKEKAIARAEELDRLEEERRAYEPALAFDADGKVREPDVPEGSAEFFWRGYKTSCSMCGKEREHGRGYLFCGMTPEGEMKTFCNVNCCDAWELIGDNTNARRAAIKAQKAKKGNNDDGTR